ncbi:carboxypeptidase-like regulatory domain-containing protein [Hymenobacter sp. UYP22]|uniref:carboxypeptidase-like regulatory domain-containing protein n=1 Tax=Hymenobacter sp. UYP22 TaxID=3156348 RepID=UPI00339A0FD8
MFSAIRFLPLPLVLVGLASGVQAQHTLSGTVEDNQGVAVPFAVVELPGRQLGVQADQQGHFTFALPTGLTIHDSLAVSALGYARRQMPVPTAATVRLQLQALAVALGEVRVRPGTPQWVGFVGEPKGSGYGQSGLSKEQNTGWQVARLCQPVTEGYLTAVRFFVKPSIHGGKTSVQAPFRVRVYAPDGPNGGPGTDLLTTTVLASAPHKGWLTVDVSRYGIRFPSQGLYIAMEWVYTSDEFLFPYTYTTPNSKEKKQGTAYGQSLAASLLLQSQTWYYTIERGWLKFQSRDPSGQQLIGDAAIQAQYVP